MHGCTSTDVSRQMKRTLAILVSMATAAACAAPTQPTHPVPSSTVVSATAPPIPPLKPSTSPMVPVDDLSADFVSYSAAIPAQVGVVVVSGSTVRAFGTWSDGPAWSTIKVPLAIAALRAAPESASLFVTAAITRSDNVAAESLWSLLGDPPAAARAVGLVLHETGDDATIVPSVRERAGFTAFGQTRWPMEAQARFAWALPCVSGSGPVLADMRDIIGDQSWGLADAETASKGGWGPGVNGNYLVRQLATLTVADGSIGVALAAEPEDGTFSSGVAAMNRLAEWVRNHRTAFAATPC